MRHVIVAVICVCAFLGQCLAQERAALVGRKPRPGFSYNQDLQVYSNDELFDLIKRLAKSHRFNEAIAVGQSALQREDCQKRADLWYEMARAGEGCDHKKEGNGQEVRDMYDQVLVEDPNHPQADYVALRLGELCDHILLPGTQRNSDKAITLFKRVIDKAKMNKARKLEEGIIEEKETIDIAVLRCYVHLGNIYSEKKDFAKAGECYEAIYVSEPNDVVSARYSGVTQQARSLREVATHLMIGNCFRPEVQESMDLLSELIAKYPDDVLLYNQAEKQKKRYLEQISRSLESLVNAQE